MTEQEFENSGYSMEEDGDSSLLEDINFQTDPFNSMEIDPTKDFYTNNGCSIPPMNFSSTFQPGSLSPQLTQDEHNSEDENVCEELDSK